MKRFALIGHPLAGSLSPALFSAAYDGRYAYDLLDEKYFEDAWMAFLNGYKGINVTAPFKQDAFAAVDWLSEDARLCGAVNLVVRSRGILKGYNTDVDGVVGALGPVGGDALVVGTGGAARAAARAAQLLGCQVTVTGRSLEKAAALGYPAVSFQEAVALRPDVVIYTLPSSAPVPAGLPLKDAIVLEAEYKHPSLDQVQCRQYIGGRQWLLHQAIAGYRLFTGEEPSAEKMSAVL
ncbi:MAG: hypothetical protein IK008_01295 [Bacteroidales bacterium]|nr:hypothetical protein [Bacteroidales bacterium]